MCPRCGGELQLVRRFTRWGRAVLILMCRDCQYAKHDANTQPSRLECPDPDWCRHVDPPRVRHDVMRERRPRRARLGYGRGRDSLGGAARDCRTA